MKTVAVTSCVILAVLALVADLSLPIRTAHDDTEGPGVSSVDYVGLAMLVYFYGDGNDRYPPVLNGDFVKKLLKGTAKKKEPTAAQIDSLVGFNQRLRSMRLNAVKLPKTTIVAYTKRGYGGNRFVLFGDSSERWAPEEEFRYLLDWDSNSPTATR